MIWISVQTIIRITFPADRAEIAELIPYFFLKSAEICEICGKIREDFGSEQNLLQNHCSGIAYLLLSHCLFYCSIKYNVLNMNNIIDPWRAFVFLLGFLRPPGGETTEGSGSPNQSTDELLEGSLICRRELRPTGFFHLAPRAFGLLLCDFSLSLEISNRNGRYSSRFNTKIFNWILEIFNPGQYKDSPILCSKCKLNQTDFRNRATWKKNQWFNACFPVKKFLTGYRQLKNLI